MKPLPVRIIDRSLDLLLFVALMFLFNIILRKIIGDSRIPSLIAFVISVPLSSILVNMINKNVAGFFYLALIAAIAFGLGLTFLYI